MKTRRYSCLVSVAAMVFLFSLSVSAQPNKAELERARTLFQEATRLEQREAWQEASEKLREALAIKETPGLHFHLAHCAEQLNELVQAAKHYARAEELIRQGAEAPDVEELLSAARARVLARLPRVTLALPRGVTDATVEVDGIPIRDEPGTPVLLDPGRHRVVVKAPGRRDFEMEIALLEGQAQTLEVSLAPEVGPANAPRASSAPPAAPPRDDGGLAARDVALIGEAGFTLAALGAGIGFSLARGSATGRVERSQRAVDAATESDPNACGSSAPPRACAELDEAIADHERASRFATIGFVAAGVGAAATLTTWALWPRTRAGAAALIVPTAGGAAASIVGRF